MASETATFTIESGATTVAQGSFVFDNDTGVVESISGTVNGDTIDGLGTYNNADNTVEPQPFFSFGKGEIAFTTSVDSQGLSFTDGGVQYDVFESGTQPAPPTPGTADSPENVTLVSSSGLDETATFASDGTESILCFAEGTRLLTSMGETAVEDLHVGDILQTVSGHRQIKWIGNRRFDFPTIGQQPIRVAAHAFGSGLPERSLHLSPGHPVLVAGSDDWQGGCLVPIMCLINGTTIERAAVKTVTYWHVELDEHDIFFAEGLPIESYIDLGSRPWFEGADGALVDPDMSFAKASGRCRPIAVDGPVVDAERRRIDDVFAERLAAACAWPTASADFCAW